MQEIQPGTHILIQTGDQVGHFLHKDDKYRITKVLNNSTLKSARIVQDIG